MIRLLHEEKNESRTKDNLDTFMVFKKEWSIMKEYLLHEKWDIIIFIFVYVTGYVSSVIFIGGPATYSGPIGVLIGFLLVQRWKYKKYYKSKKY